MEFYINHNLEIEYLELIDPNEMEIIREDYDNVKNEIAICIAAYVENVRLIDNMLIKLV
jgi:pantoate--beta-alanine ligase